MDADGANARRLSPAGTTNDGGPAWSPDGTGIAFHSGAGVPAHIYTVKRTRRGGGHLVHARGRHPAASPVEWRLRHLFRPEPPAGSRAGAHGPAAVLPARRVLRPTRGPISRARLACPRNAWF